jgi:hypothetical protein
MRDFASGAVTGGSNYSSGATVSINAAAAAVAILAGAAGAGGGAAAVATVPSKDFDIRSIHTHWYENKPTERYYQQ